MKEHIDEYGKWLVYDSGLRVLVEPSQKWHDEHPAPEPEPDAPTPTVWDEIAAAYTEGVNSIDE
jgi:hypothetical protein